ncbi:MAG: hypothetical protein AAFV77_08285 [Planctomycetota bacterium]
MNTMQLIEHAVLDAMGMLDDHESEAFNAALEASPASVRERVIAEQARLADLQGLLPEVSPDPQLREKVIIAVREAMLADAVAKAAESEEDDQPLSIRKSQGIHRGWRVGAIAGIAAAMAFGVAFWQSTLRYGDLEERFVSNLALQGAINAYGAESRDVLLRPHLVDSIRFASSQPDSAVEITLQYLEEKGVGFLNCGGLATTDTVQYALVELDTNDRSGARSASSRRRAAN